MTLYQESQVSVIIVGTKVFCSGQAKHSSWWSWGLRNDWLVGKPADLDKGKSWLTIWRRREARIWARGENWNPSCFGAGFHHSWQTLQPLKRQKPVHHCIDCRWERAASRIQTALQGNPVGFWLLILGADFAVVIATEEWFNPGSFSPFLLRLALRCWSWIVL